MINDVHWTPWRVHAPECRQVDAPPSHRPPRPGEIGGPAESSIDQCGGDRSPGACALRIITGGRTQRRCPCLTNGQLRPEPVPARDIETQNGGEAPSLETRFTAVLNSSPELREPIMSRRKSTSARASGEVPGLPAAQKPVDPVIALIAQWREARAEFASRPPTNTESWHDAHGWMVDPPPFLWTPMLAFSSFRGVFDGHTAPGVSRGVQAGGG